MDLYVIGDLALNAGTVIQGTVSGFLDIKRSILKVLDQRLELTMTKPEGRFEFPGGRLDEGETPIQAAMREWSEETHLKLPDGELTGHWVSNDGEYEGYILLIDSEDDLDIENRDEVEDPDSHGFEPLIWIDPDQLEDNPSIREEIQEDLDIILPMLSWSSKGGDFDKHFDAYRKKP